MNTRSLSNRTVFIFLALLGVIVYANSLHAPFQFDDLAYLKQNPVARSFAAIGAQVAKDPTSLFTGRPFLSLTFALNYAIGGLDVLSYHLLNLLIHIANAFLLYLLFFLYAEEDRTRPVSLKYALAASLFLVLPINTESVTYISSRSSVLSTFFILAAMLFFFRATDGRFKPLQYLAGVLLFFLGLLTKEAAIILPLLLLLFDYFFIAKSGKKLLSRLRYHVPFLAIVFILSFVYVSYVTAPSLETARPWMTHVLTELRVFVSYLQLLVVPIGLTIDHDVLPSAGMDGRVLFSLCILVSLLWVAVRFRKRKPLLSLGILWFLGSLAPFLVIRLNDYMAERWVYAASLGYSIGAAEMLLVIHKRYREAGAVLIGSVMILYGAATVMRNNLYASPVLLWQDAVAKAPEKERPYINLSNAYRESGDFVRAVAYAQTGILKGQERGGAYLEDYVNLAAAYQDEGDYRSAAAVLQSIEKYGAGHFDYQLDLGSVYMNMRQYTKALGAIRKALAIRPASAAALYLAGECSERLSDKGAADAFFLRATETVPTLPADYLGRCVAFTKQKAGAKASACFAEAIAMNPLDAKLQLNYARFFLENGYPDDAFRHYAAAARSFPGCVPAYKGMGLIMLKKGNRREAGRYLEKAASLLATDSPERKELLELIRTTQG